ncbi:MAG: tRNA pseudouridine(55) synthase TruB [Flavobacteriaceae bacterium]|nr:tRNA pseudouridine(55) synthase TruB [Flavobacteriaceae bacterium]MEC8547655.1 tRNA pseudouridine(55) synthase TruB [Bacteroidota bacterium]|tara:strand:+ start:325 stop:1020 length:696 start_codon:yes stop_codon:yes gene_type:complete
MKFTPQSITEGELLLIDKPLEWTSFQVVNKIRWALKRKFNIKKLKVGHAGTLDPLATGLLIICTGKMTKKISEFQDLDKTYIGTITLGATTPSFDLETPINKRFPLKHLNKEKIIEAKKNFIGTINQYPPIFSAIKKKGKRLYEFARIGKKIDIQSRKVVIYNLEFSKINLPDLNFKLKCSKGTYIRSLANDFGKSIDSGGYLSSLRRTAIGSFKIKNSIQLQEFIEKLKL